MQIANAPLSERLATQLNGPVQVERQSRQEQQSRALVPERASANGSREIDSDEIERRGELAQENRVQRLNDIESAPLQVQQALNSYQQTEQAAQEFELGELVGVDLFA